MILAQIHAAAEAVDAPALGGTGSLYTLAWYVFAALAVVPSLLIIISEDVVRSAFLLLGSLAGVAGLYGMLGADFVCFTQVVVYIGGILILLLFGVMLTNREPILLHRAPTHALVLPGLFAGLIFLVALLYVTFNVQWKQGSFAGRATSADLGGLLLTEFLLPFEIVSVLLLVALVGAASIARRKGDTSEPD
jgi:NADH-quinone oxidoreductase subunit J